MEPAPRRRALEPKNPKLEPRLKSLTRFAALAVVGATLAASAGAAVAQPPPPSSQGYGPRQPDLHALLHLRPDQEGAWRAYQSAAPEPQELQALRLDPSQLGTMSTPQRLDRIGAMLSAQLNVFHRQAEATRAFYALLSPDQRRTFDQVTAPPGRGGPPQR